MNELKALAPSGAIASPPLNVPPKTCLFFDFHGEIMSSWSYFARNFGEDYKSACTGSIVAGNGNSVIALLSNTDRSAPVSFWEDRWGGTVDMAQLGILESHARIVHAAGGSFFPCFFCDEYENSLIRNASAAEHERAFSLLIAHLRPYCPGFLIGLESSEYFNKAQHNAFYDLIKRFAPDRYVGTHMQRPPEDGMPKLDFWCYEHSWHPGKGDEHSPAEVVTETREAAKRGIYTWPIEYNLNPSGERIKEQSQALIAAGFGCGGRIK